MPSLFSSFCQSKASFILTQSCLHPAKDQHAAAEMSKSMGRILTAKKKENKRDAWSAVWQWDWGAWLGATSVQTGRGRNSELSPHREVQAHTSLHIIYLARKLFGVFLFILRLACLTPVWTFRSGICRRIMLQPLTAFFTFLALRVFALACYGLMQTTRARSLSITLVQNVMIK